MKHFFCSCLLLSLSVIVPAATIHVPADQPTIQAAINAASNGDIVLVAPGTYFENINFSGKAITVRSSGGANVTTIDGGNAGSVVTIDSGEALTTVLHGFTIQHGNASFDGGGVYISSASPTITGSLITGNVACNGGAGIAVEFSSALVQSNNISNNSGPGCDLTGAGMLVGGFGAAQIIGNVIKNNTTISGDGGGIAINAAGTPTLRNNIISGNVAKGISPGSQGGGIWIVNYSDALIVQNLIFNNTAIGEGAGIYFGVPFGYRGPLLVNNTIVGTISSVQGSAVYASGFYDQVRFFNNLMIGATGTSAIYCDSTYDQIPPTLTNNDSYSANGSGTAGACVGEASQNGNISADPLFSGRTNFNLKAASPAIDAGENSAPDLLLQDLAGGARIVDGNGDGIAIIDMGAYEYPK